MKTKIYNLMVIMATLFIGTHQLSAQQIKPWSVKRVYLNGSSAINGGGTVQLNMHFNNGWMGFIASENGQPKSKNLPSDYLNGSSNLFGFEFEDGIPTDNINMVTIGMGKVLTPPSDKAWITATGGISIGSSDVNSFTRQEVVRGSFFGLFGGTSSNYSTTTETRTAIGITAGFEGHVNLFRFMALSSAAKLLVSNARVHPYLTLGMDIGLMRPARKNMIKSQNKL